MQHLEFSTDDDDVSGFDELPPTQVTEVAEAPVVRHRTPYLILLSGTDEGRATPLEDSTIVLGRATDASFRLYEDGVSRRHAELVVEKGIVVIRDLESTNGTFVNGVETTSAELRDGDRVRLGAQAELKFAYQDNVEAAFTERQYAYAKRDSLTGVFNKRHLLEQLDSEFSFARRHNRPLAVAMVDLDYFKKVNDTYGHPVGDQVLVAVSQALAEGLRDHDMIARFGGEEFALVMRATDVAGAAVVAERIRRAVSTLVIEGVRVTCSVGFASWPEITTESAGGLVEAADLALYDAKRGGRNRCVARRD